MGYSVASTGASSVASGAGVASAAAGVASTPEGTREGELFYYDVEGNGFLYNMVRILVGTMLAAAKGTLPPDAMQQALSSGRRNDAGPTAPAHGLTLMRVVYPDFDTAEIVQP